MSDNVQFPQYSADGLPITYVPNPFLADGKPIDSQWKQPVRVHTEGNIVLSGLQVIDGVGVMEGDRVLVRIQANAAENGIYIASAGAWLRAPDMYLWPQFVAAVVATEEGISIGDTVWVCDAPVNGVVGVTPNNWIQVSQSTGTLGTFTPLRAIVSDAAGVPQASPTTSQEIAYLGGVTSSVQQQFNALDNKASSAFSIAVAGTNAAAGAQSTANSALSTANSAFALAQIGTNTGSAAYSLAQTGSNIAYDAYAIAEAGTTIGSLAYNYATALGDIYVRTTRFATISSGTSGSVALPPNSSVVLDDFGGTTDAVITVMVGGMPTFNHAFTTAGAIVTTTFDSSGAYALSGPPDPYPVALVYRVRQKLSQFDSTGTDIIGDYDVEPVNFIAGTPNQVYVNGSTTAQFGSIILSTPQDIAPTSTPTFAGLTSTGSVYSPNIDQTTQVAYSGSSVAWAAWELAQVGTETGGTVSGTAAYDIAVAAYALAQIGTNTGTAAYTLAQAGTSSLFTYVRNAGTVVIGSGSAVSVLSSDGTVPTVILATNAVRFVARAVLGLASGSIAAGGYGYICHYGSVSGVDLTGVATGASLFLETHGSITPYLPVAPTSKVFVGFCLSPGSQGSVFVFPQATDALSELSDVELSSRSIGDGIIWNGSLWTNIAYTSTPAYQLADSAYTLAYQAEVDAQFATIQSSEALQLAQVGTNTGSTAYSVAQSAWALAQIGTNVGTAALNAAATAQSTADSAFSIAVIGTNAAAAAQSTADSAWALAQIGTNVGTAALSAAASAQSTADTAYFIAQIGTNTGTVAYNAALSAQSTANSAYFIAEIGTNTGTAAYTLAESGSSVAWSAWVLANAGTELPQSSYDLALAAYHLAEIGTNVGTAALNAAATAQSTADTAYYIAQVGTNTGTAAYELATSGSNVAWAAYVIAQDGTSNTSTTALAAYALAQIGTNTGSAAYELASFATNTGTAALNAAASAQSTANTAYFIAQVGTNTGSAAYTLAESGSSVAWQAWELAQIGTTQPSELAQAAWELAQIGTNVGSTAYSVAQSAYSIAVDGTSAAATAQFTADFAYYLAQVGTNVGSAAYSLAAMADSTANSAWALAQIGTNVGSAAFSAAETAQSTADSAFGIAVIGTNAAASAQSTADSAWSVAQIGTNTGSTAYAVAEQAYALAQLGTVIPPLSTLPDVYIPSPTANQSLIFNGSVWVASDTQQTAVGAGIVFYLDGEFTEFPGYEKLLFQPADIPEAVETIDANQSFGDVLIDPYLSVGTADRDVMDGGLWTYNTYCSTTGSDCRMHVETFLYDGTTENLLWDFYFPITPNGVVNLEQVTLVKPAAPVTKGVDRILVKYFGTCSSAGTHQITLYHSGSEHYSNIQTPFLYAHNALPGLQGGTSPDQFYHVTHTINNGLNAADNPSGTNAFITASALAPTTSIAQSAYLIAESGSNTANSAFALAQIGTNTGSAAYALADEADSIADSAFAMAQIGTNTGSAAYSLAQAAYELASIGTNVGSTAYSVAQSAFTLAEVGTNAGSAAYSVAQSAWELAQVGTNTGSTAYSVAESAWALAQIGTNTGTAAYNLAFAAGVTASFAFDYALAALYVGTDAYHLAQIGTNTGTAALGAAATAQSTANSAFSIAVDGTNAAATARSTANSALSIASIGTNTGSAAYSVAQSAFSIASIGTNTGSTAYSVANSAWNLAQIGTNTGTAAYTLAQSGSSVAWQAYSLALQGTSHTLAGLTDVALTGPTAQQVLTYNGSIWINDDVPVVISPSTFNLYLDDTASGTDGYNTLTTMSGGAEVLDNISVTSNNPTPIESYISSGVSVTVLPAGVWMFESYVSAANTGRSVVVTTDVYKRSMAGVETYLFSGTTDVFSPVGTPSRVIATAATGSYTVALTDKLVAKYWFIKSAGGNTTLTLYHNGSNHASFIQTTLGFVHNQLAGLQGGTSDEYYHTTANQNAALVGDGGAPSAANPYSTHQFTAAIQNTANSAFSIAQVGTNTGSTAYSVAQSAWTLAQFGTTQSAAGAYQLAQVGTNIGSYAVAYAVPAYSIAQIGTNTGSAAYSYAAAAYALAQTGTNADATTRSIANSAFSVAQIGTNTGSTAYSVAQSAWTLAQQGTYSVSTISNGTTLISASPASYVYLCNTSSGSVVLVLPNALGWSGQRVNAKMIGSAGSVIMRSSTGSQTIDGALNQTVYTQYVSIQATTDGLNWYII